MEVAVQHNLTEVLAAAEAHLDTCTWAIYDVQRVIRPKGAKQDEVLSRAKAKALGVAVIKHPGDPNVKGQTFRRTTTLKTGTRREMTDVLARAKQGRHEPGRTPRLWLVEAQRTYPTRERLLVAAPAGVDDKAQDIFPQLWAEATARQGAAGQLTRNPITT